MFSYAVNLAVRRSGLAAVMALGLSATAQQAIQFSKPANQDPALTANSFLPSNHKSPSDFKAPASIFGDGGSDASFDVLPGGPAVVYPNANNQQWQKMLQDRKNWALMTPEQILHVPTPETILGLTDPREDPKLSPEERFLQRQERQSEMAATNGMYRPNGMFSPARDPNQGLFQDSDDRSRLADAPHGPNLGVFGSGPARMQSAFISQNPETPADPNQKFDATWASPFGSPAPLPKPTPAQLAGMERFRAMMEPPVKEKTPAVAGFALPAVPAPDPNLQPLPVFNPSGRSFTPLGNDITKIMPLAGVTGPAPAPAKKPPLVNLPPWMTTGLQNPTMPQRQF
jgi:hypothetical protein